VGEEVVHVTWIVRPFVEAIGSKSNSKGVCRATLAISTHPDQDVFELVRLQLWPPGDSSFVLDVPSHDLRAQDSYLTYTHALLGDKLGTWAFHAGSWCNSLEVKV
jgi:hypothetical protein